MNAGPSDTFVAGQLFSVAAALPDLQATGCTEALQEMVEAAVKGGLLPRARRDEVLQALEDREQRGSTGLGKGIAVPHAKIRGLRKPCGVLARSTAGVDFRAVDGEPVHALVLVVFPESRAEDHLTTLRWLSVVARDPDFISFLRQARTPEQLLEVVLERSS